MQLSLLTQRLTSRDDLVNIKPKQQQATHQSRLLLPDSLFFFAHNHINTQSIWWTKASLQLLWSKNCHCLWNSSWMMATTTTRIQQECEHHRLLLLAAAATTTTITTTTAFITNIVTFVLTNIWNYTNLLPWHCKSMTCIGTRNKTIWPCNARRASSCPPRANDSEQVICARHAGLNEAFGWERSFVAFL